MHLEATYRIALATLLVAGFAIGGRYRRRADRVGGSVSRRQEGAILVPLRLAGVITHLALLAYILRPTWIAFASLPLPDTARLAGVPVGLLGLGLIAWTFRHLGLNVTDTVVTRERHTLVLTGPYRHVRHPLYSAFFLLLASYTLLTASSIVLVAGSVGAILLVVRTDREEELLVHRFGDEYRRYAARTRRFLPRRPVAR